MELSTARRLRPPTTLPVDAPGFMTDELEKLPEDAASVDAGDIISDDGLPTVGPVARVRKFPQTPGVYLMKDSAGRVIYVGKAKNLRARAGSLLDASAGPDTQCTSRDSRNLRWITTSAFISMNLPME